MTHEPVDSDIPLAAAINPNTFEVDITLEIACDDEDQIVSRPVGEGYTYKDLQGRQVVSLITLARDIFNTKHPEA